MCEVNPSDCWPEWAGRARHAKGPIVGADGTATWAQTRDKPVLGKGPRVGSGETDCHRTLILAVSGILVASIHTDPLISYILKARFSRDISHAASSPIEKSLVRDHECIP